MISNLFGLFAKSILELAPIVNPILSAFFFLQQSNSSHFSKREIIKHALRFSFYVFLMLCITLLVGVSVFHFFSITTPYIRIVGGLLIFKIAWSIFNKQSNYKVTHLKDGLFYPLTFPLTVGGGSIAVVISLSTYIDQNDFSINLLEDISVILGIICVSIMIFFCCYFFEKIKSLIKEDVLTIFSFVFSFILLPLGLTFIWDGLSTLIKQLDWFHSIH